MRKLGTILSIAILTTLGFNNSASAQVEEGNIIIDPYYGFPNFGGDFIDLLSADYNEIDGITTSAIGPAGIRLEYMLADNFGLGVDFIFNSINASGTVDSLNTDGTVYRSYDTKVYMRRYRVQLRANYHFVQTDNLDAYVGFGAGTNIRTIGFTTDYPNLANESVSGALIPVSFRFALGTRYYFTDNIGLNAELGLGGPVVSAGLSFKF